MVNWLRRLIEHPENEWHEELEDTSRVTVHGFRASERLKVHEARTLNDRESCVVRKPYVAPL